MKLSVDEFVKMWQSSGGPSDMAAKTGMTVVAIAARCSRYRKRGIPLKRFTLEKRAIKSAQGVNTPDVGKNA